MGWTYIDGSSIAHRRAGPANGDARVRCISFSHCDPGDRFTTGSRNVAVELHWHALVGPQEIERTLNAGRIFQSTAILGTTG